MLILALTGTIKIEGKFRSS